MTGGRLDHRGFGDFGQGLFHGRIGRLVAHQDQRARFRPSCPSGWMTEEIPIFNSARMAVILASVPGLSITFKPQIITGNDFVDGQDFSVAVMRHERRNAVAGAVLEIQGRVRDVAQDRAGRGVLARAASVKERIAHHVAAHEDRVKNMIDAGQDVGVGHQRRDKRKPARPGRVAAFCAGRLCRL